MRATRFPALVPFTIAMSGSSDAWLEACRDAVSRGTAEANREAQNDHPISAPMRGNRPSNVDGADSGRLERVLDEALVVVADTATVKGVVTCVTGVTTRVSAP